MVEAGKIRGRARKSLDFLVRDVGRNMDVIPVECHVEIRNKLLEAGGAAALRVTWQRGWPKCVLSERNNLRVMRSDI